MGLTTVKEYCTERGVSRQFVYEYINKGKFEVLNLPVFIEYDGVRQSIGTKKFLKVPPQYAAEKKAYWSGDVSDNDYAEAMAIDATDDKELQCCISHFLSIDNAADSDAFKKDLLHNKYPETHLKRAALDAAFAKCVALMQAEMADLAENVSRL